MSELLDRPKGKPKPVKPRERRDNPVTVDLDLGKVPRGQAKKQMAELPIAFSLGDGDILKKNGKTPPGQLKDKSKVRVTALGDPRREKLGFHGAAFKLETLDIDAVDVVVRVEIDYSELALWESNDWIHRVQFVSIGDCAVDAPTADDWAGSTGCCNGLVMMAGS